MAYRREKKFRLSKSDQKLLKISLLKKGMSTLYPKRIVTSCYFDTKDLRIFRESDEGILPRKKIRFRWYEENDPIQKEIKIRFDEPL